MLSWCSMRGKRKPNCIKFLRTNPKTGLSLHTHHGHISGFRSLDQQVYVINTKDEVMTKKSCLLPLVCLFLSLDFHFMLWLSWDQNARREWPRPQHCRLTPDTQLLSTFQLTPLCTRKDASRCLKTPNMQRANKRFAGEEVCRNAKTLKRKCTHADARQAEAIMLAVHQPPHTHTQDCSRAKCQSPLEAFGWTQLENKLDKSIACLPSLSDLRSRVPPNPFIAVQSEHTHKKKSPTTLPGPADMNGVKGAGKPSSWRRTRA